MAPQHPLPAGGPSREADALMEIAHTLARAETALLTSDRAKAVEELERLQTRAAALVSRLQRQAGANAQAA